LPTTAVDKTEQEVIEEQILAELGKLAGVRSGQDRIQKEGTKYVLPQSTSLRDDITFLVDYADALETETAFTRVFKYRPWDGAACFQAALMRVWGTAGVGQATYSFFGKNPPEMRTIEVGPHQTMQIPWGQIQFAPLSATITLSGVERRDFGTLFQMIVVCPKKYANQVEGLFTIVEQELKEHSIYKGQAFNGAEEPGFLDPYSVDRNKVIYTEEIGDQLDANIWSMLRHTKVIKQLGLPLKRSVLLGGPYGTGKSLTAMVTAQIAIENGWTFVQCRPDDDLARTLQTARLYEPAVVFYEDIDNLSRSGDPETISKLLDMFDGISAKGTQLAMVLTTNKVDRIHKGMLRPGRLDALIMLDALDEESFIRLVKAAAPDGMLDPEMDFQAVAASMKGFLPAFVKEAIDRAVRYAVARVEGKPAVFTTHDFVRAAEGLRPQLVTMNEAKDTVAPDEASVVLGKIVKAAVTTGEVAILDPDDGSKQYVLGTTNSST